MTAEALTVEAPSVVSRPPLLLRPAQRALLALSGRMIVAQVAPLFASLWVARMIGAQGAALFSAYMIVATINLTVFIAFGGVLQTLYYLGGRALGRSEPDVYRETMAGAGRLVLAGAILAAAVSCAVGPALAWIGVPPTLAAPAGRIGTVAAIGLPPALYLVLYRVHAALHGEAGAVARLYVINALVICLGALAIARAAPLAAETRVLLVTLVVGLVNWLSALVTLLRRGGAGRGLAAMIAATPRWRSAAAAIWALGWPVAMVIFLDSLCSSASTVIVARFWPGLVPAHSAVLLWVTIGLVVPLGIAQATMQLVALAEARDDAAASQTTVRSALVLAAAFGIAAMAGMASFPAPLAALVLGPATLGGLRATLPWLMAAGGILLIAQALIVVAAGALRAVGETRAPLLYAAIGYVVVALGGALLLGPVLAFGIVGTWWGLNLGFYATAIAVLFRARRLIAAPATGGEAP